MTKDQPEPGKQYSLTGKVSIASGNSWKESEVKKAKLDKLIKANPDVPSEVYDIEESQELADAYTEFERNL